MRFATQVLALGLLISSVSTTFAADLQGPVQWQLSPRTALQTAKEQQRPILMYFTADYCGYCKKLDRNTWSNPAVADKLNSEFVPLQLDGDKFGELAEMLSVRGYPTMVVISPEGKELGRISGYIDATQMQKRLSTLAAIK